MFCTTVYQGNNAYSWNTTARSHPGAVIASPPTLSSPRVGCSNPARRLSKVVFPHPLGPTIEKNSFFSTWKFTSSKARSGSPFIEKCTLLTLVTSTCIMASVPAMHALLPFVPGHRQTRGLAHQIVEHEPQNANQHHAEQDVIAAEQRAGVVDHVAESARRRDQLARDQSHPSDSESDAHARKYVRQRSGENHGEEHLPRPRT